MLRTLFFYLTYVPLTVILLLLGVPLSLLWRDAMRVIAVGWARIGLRLGGVRVTVEGREHLPAEPPAIFMANHQSNFDIPVLLDLLPHRFGFLAKVELFRIPLFSWGMRRFNCIPIDRGNRQQALASMQQAAQRVRGGLSVSVFPEGTRTQDGQLLPFKKGGFVLAMEAGVPIVPIALHGGFAVMPKSRLTIRPGPIRVRILPPIATTGYSEAQRDQLIERVHSAIAQAMADMETAC